MKYNYVVFGAEDDYYKYAYSMLNTYEDAIYLSKPEFQNWICGGILNFLRQIHLSEKVNKIVKLPFKEIWNKCLYKKQFNDHKPICFVFFSSSKFTRSINYGFVEHLREKYKNSKFVVFYQDLVRFPRDVSLQTYKEKMDLVISFDFEDAQKYNLLYHSLVYSDISNQIKYGKNTDVFFVGAIKNRHGDILKMFNALQAQGLKCDFNIVVDNPKKYKNKRGLTYCKSFSYLKNLEHVKSCKCVAEIMQKGGTGFTIRVCEAIIFNKKIISNNLYLKNTEFYNPNDIIIIDDMNMIKAKPLKSQIDNKPHLDKYKGLISPYAFLQYIDEKIVSN